MIIAKAMISISAVVWFALKVQWQEVYSRLGQIDPVIMVGAFIVFVLRLLPLTLRWQHVGETCGYSLTFGESFYGYMVGGFFNAFLPTGRGGDAVRAILVARRRSVSFGGIMGTVFIERLVGLIVTVFIVLFTSLTAYSQVIELQNAIPSILLLTFILVAFGLLLLSSYFQTLFLKIMTNMPFPRITKSVFDTLEVFRIYRVKPQTFIMVIIYSLLNQIVFIFSGFLVAKSIADFDASWYTFAIVIPLIFIAELIPSIGGYGIREAGYVVFFGWFGIAAEPAVIYGLLQLFFIWVSALIGAAFFVWGTPQKSLGITEPQTSHSEGLSDR